jgi:hypothetical protein
VALLPAKLTIIDVDDVEQFASQIAQFSGLDLSHHGREDITTYLIETCWEPGRTQGLELAAAVNRSFKQSDPEGPRMRLDAAGETLPLEGALSDAPK